MVSQLIETPKAGEIREYKMLVGGEWVDARSGKTFESVNPYTGKVWATVPEAGDEDVDRAVRAAREAFDEGPWGKMTGTERARLLRRFADVLAENAEDIAVVESTDNGKLLREMGGQLKALPEWYYYFAGAADKIEGATIPSDKPNFFVYTRREPIGVVGAITPWNSPLLLLTFKLAPALAAGCTFVVKTAEQTPASTLEFARLFEEAGFPPGVFNVVTGFGPTTGSALVRHPGVDKVAFTGSTETGKQVMKDAADHLAKVTLELGGKSPNILFEDADMEAVANGVVSGIFAATGQTCIAGSRLFVQERLYDELVTLNLGHPDGRALAKRLAAEADILVENFKPGTLEKLGLGWEALRELHPRLILVRVSGYGQTGPYKDRPGFANIGEAMGGIRYVTGEPGRAPVRSGISLGDSLASLYAVIGALMAVHARDVLGTGEGQVVDVALYEAVFNLMESLIPEYNVAGIVRERTGSSLPGITPSNTYCSGDGSYVAIGGNSDAIFKHLMKAIDRPELGEDPRYRTNADRTEHADELDSLIEDWVRQHTTEEIMRSLEEAAVPVGPIYSAEDIVEDEQYHARGMLLETEIEGIGTVKMPGLVPKLSETPGQVEWYGGPLGAHNEEVYGGLLGLSTEKIERLSEEGVI